MPYYGKVSIDGINYHGSAQFQFSLEDANGTEHWRNGMDANESIRVFVVNGRYSVMLGGQGMNPLPPELFLKHQNLYLRVKFDNGDGTGLRYLGPDQLITATPRALVAEVAKVAEKLSGAITSDMLSPEVLSKLDANQSGFSIGPITLSMLAPEVTAKLESNHSAAPMGPITLDMLPADVLADLNKSAPAITSITRDMLPADVLADLNKSAPAITSITRDMLPADVLADLNKSTSAVGPITLSMLDAEVTAKLDSDTRGTTIVNNSPAVGSLIAISYGESAPAGYSLYQRGTPKELVWEEKAPVSVARNILDGAAVLNGMIYVTGGFADTGRTDLFERYDPVTNTWQTLNPLSSARNSVTTAAMTGKIYSIGGVDDNGKLSTVEIYEPISNSWTAGPTLPAILSSASSIEKDGKLYLIGGENNNSRFATNYMLEANASDWVAKAPMSVTRAGQRLVVYENRIWAMGGFDNNYFLKLVESYDPVSDSWRTEPSLPEKKNWASAWVANGKIYLAGGKGESGIFENKIFSFSRETGWVAAGNLPENKFAADAVVLNDKVYVIAGSTASGVYSNKVFAADLNASVAGVYDLYRKDGNASAGTPLVQAEVADGSVTTAKLDATILKYLKPEITAQPQGKIVYADSNVSFSVTAEGKYLNYQWKKDGSNLTGETNATLTLTDANSTQHDGNYSVVVSNDFGSVETGAKMFAVLDSEMNGLVGWWKFDETNGTIAYDSSGNGNDGNLTNGPTWTSGKIGGALSFDGVDDFVQLVRGDVVGNGLDLSISFWIKPSAVSTKAIFGEYGKNSSNQYQYTRNHLTISNGAIGFDQYPPAGGISGKSELNSITYNIWNHVVFSQNSSAWSLSIGGIIVSGSNGVEHYSGPTPEAAWIGGRKHEVGNPSGSRSLFDGLIDDMRIYDRALSAAEVQALYNLGQ